MPTSDQKAPAVAKATNARETMDAGRRMEWINIGTSTLPQTIARKGAMRIQNAEVDQGNITASSAARLSAAANQNREVRKVSKRWNAVGVCFTSIRFADSRLSLLWSYPFPARPKIWNKTGSPP